MSKITNDRLGLNPVWHRMLYSCTHTATVMGVKVLTYRPHSASQSTLNSIVSYFHLVVTYLLCWCVA